MKLHAPDEQFPVLESHDFAFFRIRDDFQAIWESGALQNEGVVAGRFKTIGQSREKPFPAMANGGGLAVHQTFRSNYFPAEILAHALVPETNPENRFLPDESLYDFQTAARLVGVAGSRGNNDGVRGQFPCLVYRDGIVAADFLLYPQLPKILDQVVGEGIKIVYHEQLHAGW